VTPSAAFKRAIRVASNKLPFKSEKSTNTMLEYAASDMAEAYRIGAEEAQEHIVQRLVNLAANAERKAAK
jgi:hypothetical protein